MENNKPDYTYDNVFQINDADASRKFLAGVFSWMFVALGISGAFAYIFSNSPSLMRLMVDSSTQSLSGLAYIIMFAPLAFVLIMSFGINRISYPVLTVLYIAYAAVTGMSLSFILLAFTASSVLGVFITTSVLFGIMAIAGYTTKTDLTKFGSILFMLLIGVIIASVVNMLILHNSGFDLVISYVGVAVFVGLTAYDVQKLKAIGAGITYGDASASKMALMGGLTLYLDFVNLFLFLLRLFGRRR